jgi:hypothetical protein
MPGALLKIDWLPAPRTMARAAQFVGENLHLGPAAGAAADKRGQFPELLEPRAMFCAVHPFHLIFRSRDSPEKQLHPY